MKYDLQYIAIDEGVGEEACRVDLPEGAILGNTQTPSRGVYRGKRYLSVWVPVTEESKPDASEEHPSRYHYMQDYARHAELHGMLHQTAWNTDRDGLDRWHRLEHWSAVVQAAKAYATFTSTGNERELSRQVRLLEQLP